MFDIEAVNDELEEYVKGNSKLQLVNIDTGFIQVQGLSETRTVFSHLPRLYLI